MLWLLLGLGVAAISGLALAMRHHAPEAVIRRSLTSTTIVRIADFPEGATGKIMGVLRYAGDHLEAPLTGRHCAYFDVQVSVECDKPGCGHFDLVASDFGGQDFLIQDDTGVALVVVENEAALIHRDREQEATVTTNPKDRLGLFLLKQKQATRGRFFYREGVLEQGETVVAWGHGTWEPDPDPSTAKLYRERAIRLVLRAPARSQIYISDDPEMIRLGEDRRASDPTTHVHDS